MPQYAITPWRDRSELFNVRRQLYQLQNDKEVDERRYAVELVGAWKIRGHLPHAVESTALLVDAVLHHDIKKNTTFSIRAVYAAAFCRFVTGYCDIGQNAAVKKSMYDVAREIGMPATFVEVRHEATHGELPSLPQIQRNVREALDWLWQNYWSKLEEPIKPTEQKTVGNQPSTESGVSDLQVTLRRYLRGRKAEIKKSSARKSLGTGSSEAAISTCKDLVSNCKGHEDKLKTLVVELVSEGMLIPAGRVDNNLKGAYLIWDSLLVRLNREQPQFLHLLVEALLDSPDELRDACLEWLSHILLGSDWADARQSQHAGNVADCVPTLLMNPSPSSYRLARVLLVEADASFKETYAPLFNASLPLLGDENLRPVEVEET